VSQPDKNGVEQSVATVDAPIPVDRRDPISLSPPLRGPRWFDGDSCCKQIGGHRWALSPINGRITAAETFAIDFVQLLENNRIFHGPIDQLSSYAYYGASVYNASAGTVVEVVRDLPDEKPGMDPENITAANAAGNHVIVAMKGGQFALYAHLIPFSITVNVGDYIDTGCILGRLGNSGSSSIPHLHFQMMDSPSSLGAHGLPFVFDRMSRDYRYAGTLDDQVRQTVSGEPLSLMPVRGQTQFQNTMSLIFDLLNFR
jgi:murein DD-endopeptidase MepM/ murein hydrolase activator NlpD